MTSEPAVARAPDVRASLHRALGFRDLLFFYIVTTFSLRWIATAAAAGPSALVIWIIAAVGLFVPLVFATLELSSRYPDEGGIYVWSKRAFGPFPAFITGWSYWATNLPYFPSLLYFAAGNLLFVGGPSWQAWSSNSIYFMTASMIGLTFAVTVNVLGLDIGKWLSNAGGVAAWIVAGLLIALGAVSWARFGSATPIDAASLIPSTSLKDVIFWSTIAFAFGGVESASTMGEEIRDARRTIPRAVVAAAVIITLLYLAGTLSVLLAIPKEQISGLQGIMQAMQAITARVGVGVAGAAGRRAGHAERDGRRRRMVCGDGAAAVCGRYRSVSAERVCVAAPAVPHAARRLAGAGGDFRGVRRARSGRHVGARRLRRARQHEHHHVLRAVSLHVRGA